MKLNPLLIDKISCNNLAAVNCLIILTFVRRLIMRHFVRSFLFCLAVLSFSFPTFAQTSEASMPAPKASHTEALGSVVNINAADAQTIINAHIKGIGKKRAEAIVAYRQQHGPFKSIDDLKNIKGLSEKVISANRSRLTL
jgi:competence protein ComEA